MFDLYGFGAIMLFAFFYVNLAWALLSAHTPPPGIAGKEEIVEPAVPKVQKWEQRVPALNATLRVPQLEKPAAHSAR